MKKTVNLTYSNVTVIHGKPSNFISISKVNWVLVLSCNNKLCRYYFDINVTLTDVNIFYNLPIPWSGHCSQVLPQPFPMSLPQQQSFLESFIGNGSEQS